MFLNRRAMCLLLPATAMSLLGGAALVSRDENILPSSAFSFEKLPVKVSGSAEIRAILKGKLATGGTYQRTLYGIVAMLASLGVLLAILLPFRSNLSTAIPALSEQPTSLSPSDQRPTASAPCQTQIRTRRPARYEVISPIN